MYKDMYNDVVRFVWHEPKRQSTLQSRGLDFADAAAVFAGPTLTFEDDRVDYGEQRLFYRNIP